jgi:hypothetical protein
VVVEAEVEVRVEAVAEDGDSAPGFRYAPAVAVTTPHCTTPHPPATHTSESTTNARVSPLRRNTVETIIARFSSWL